MRCTDLNGRLELLRGGFCCLLSISADRQGRSGLGLDAQRRQSLSSSPRGETGDGPPVSEANGAAEPGSVETKKAARFPERPF
jgi:hypothetical protein